MLICSLVLGIVFQAVASTGQPVTRISAGSYHSVFVRDDGSLWGMGRNFDGQLGNGTLQGTNLPAQILPKNVAAVAAGGNHTLLLKSDGSLWVMGDNSEGQLGDGTYSSTNLPEEIVASNVTAVAASRGDGGGTESFFLKRDGSLWGMGWNYYGELGDGTFGSPPRWGTNQPEQIVASNVTAIASGSFHSLFLKSDGSVWGMGDDSYGELGDGNTIFQTWTNVPEEILASNVMAIAVGSYYSLLLKNDGSLWGMGYNEVGDLGDGTLNDTNWPEMIVASNVVAIAAGTQHSLFLKSDGSLWGMGANRAGQLGPGTNLFITSPELIVSNDVTAIAAGEDHSLFIKKDGSLWGMGSNIEGQLGVGSNVSRTYLPMEIVSVPAGYNVICGQLLSDDEMELAFAGIAGAAYVLERSFDLAQPAWVAQATNFADPNGFLNFTNRPDVTRNNFWRVRLQADP